MMLRSLDFKIIRSYNIYRCYSVIIAIIMWWKSEYLFKQYYNVSFPREENEKALIENFWNLHKAKGKDMQILAQPQPSLDWVTLGWATRIARYPCKKVTRLHQKIQKVHLLTSSNNLCWPLTNEPLYPYYHIFR